MDRPLEGRVAIVTGSSRGIGAAIVKRFAQVGARVVINYLSNARAAQDVVNEIQAAGGGAIAVQADAGTIAGGQTLLQECLRAFGRVDILVLNAGVMPNALLKDTEDATFNSVFDLTVKGPLFLAQAVAPHLTEGASAANSYSLCTHTLIGGRIFFVSNIATKKSTLLPDYLLMASSGGAIEQVSRTLAKDLGTRGITVNTISPGIIDTDGYRERTSEHKRQFIANLHMQKRVGVPEEVAEVVGFLASQDGRWINGQNIQINGVSSFYFHYSSKC